jgi:hypothetical protein
MAMLKTWCQRFFVFGDFDDAAFSESFFDLLDKFEGIHAMQRVAVALKTDLLSRIENRESGIISVAGTPPPIIYPHDKFTAYYKFDKTFRLQMWPSEEVARQFSLYEFAIFRKIQPKEMLNQAWSKKTRHEFAPNVTADISHFNVISSLAAYSVVSVPDLQQRQRMYVPRTLWLSCAIQLTRLLHVGLVDQACCLHAASQQSQRRDADPVGVAKQQRIQARNIVPFYLNL